MGCSRHGSARGAAQGWAFAKCICPVWSGPETSRDSKGPRLICTELQQGLLWGSGCSRFKVAQGSGPVDAQVLCNRTVTGFHSRRTDGQPALVSTSALLLVVASPQPPPAQSRPTAELLPPAEQPLTYYLSQQNNVLASHNEDASRDVPILLAHMDALHSLVQHQVCCSDQEKENNPRHHLFWLQKASPPSPKQQWHRSFQASRWALSRVSDGSDWGSSCRGSTGPKPTQAKDSRGQRHRWCC